MDEAHGKRIEALQGLEKKCEELAQELNKGECRQHGPETSCLRLEEERPLTREEREKGWSRRPYWAYDPQRMCRGCAACWHGNMAMLAMHDEVRLVQIAAREERREASAP